MTTAPVSLPASAAGLDLHAPPHLPADQAVAARQLEGVFLSMLIKELRETSSNEGLFPGDSAGIHGGIFDMMMGEFLAENSPGIGISRYLLAQKGGEIAPHSDIGQSSVAQ